MRGEEHEVKKAAEKIGLTIGEDFADKIADAAKNVVEKGIPLKDALGFPNEQIEAMYAQAYRLYNTGKYEEAIHFFRMLVALDPTEGKYALGMGACFHMMKEYENAANIYMTASVLDSNNPIPLFHASDCYIQMKDPASALFVLDMAIQRAGNKPEYQILKDRAQLTTEGLKVELMRIASPEE